MASFATGTMSTGRLAGAMRGRVWKTEVSVIARENLTSAASALEAAHLAKTVPFGEGRMQRKRACQPSLKNVGRKVDRAGKKWGRRNSGLGLQDSGFFNTQYPFRNSYLLHRSLT
jgi:hypothetical protein